ncbi:hypothetical protein KW787_00625 [Candidatus Pacearchaeota archaeon]|nr:hypothetical protein [Candidatus Pacearchaeota archaeon]
MKSGYKHKTGVFGTDAENYVSRLFLMMKNPNGMCRPDLISINGRYDPKLSIEVKSGANYKGVMVDYQLRYAITTGEDYREIFGEEIPRRENLFPGIEWADTYPMFQPDPVAYYYNIINRVDEMTSKDLDRPFSAIKLRWGDQFLVPNEYGFYAFAVSRIRRSGEKINEVINDLRDLMKNDICNGSGSYYHRKSDKRSWQDIHSRDIKAIFEDDPRIATEDGKKRIDLLRTNYPDLERLERIKILGPNDTTIYVLAKKEHSRLFDRTLRKTVGERAPIIEDITQERKRAERLLSKISYAAEVSLFGNGNVNEDMRISMNLKRPQLQRLERLAKWEGKDEFISTDEIPF